MIAVIERCRDDIASPYLVHRIPQRRRKDYQATKQHPTQVAPEMITRAFHKLREQLGLFQNLEAKQRPSFHEIRGLGAALYEKAGVNPQLLLGHTGGDSTTKVYLDCHDLRWAIAEAGLAL